MDVLGVLILYDFLFNSGDECQLNFESSLCQSDASLNSFVPSLFHYLIAACYCLKLAGCIKYTSTERSLELYKQALL